MRVLEAFEKAAGITSPEAVESNDKAVLVLGPSEVLFPFTLRQSYIVLNTPDYNQQLNIEMLVCAVHGEFARVQGPPHFSFPPNSSLPSEALRIWMERAKKVSGQKHGCGRSRFEGGPHGFQLKRWAKHYGGEMGRESMSTAYKDYVGGSDKWERVIMFVHDSTDNIEGELMQHRICHLEHGVIKEMVRANPGNMRIETAHVTVDDVTFALDSVYIRRHHIRTKSPSPVATNAAHRRPAGSSGRSPRRSPRRSSPGRSRGRSRGRSPSGPPAPRRLRRR
jgi:hypothetical protein